MEMMCFPTPPLQVYYNNLLSVPPLGVLSVIFLEPWKLGDYPYWTNTEFQVGVFATEWVCLLRSAWSGCACLHALSLHPAAALQSVLQTFSDLLFF